MFRQERWLLSARASPPPPLQRPDHLPARAMCCIAASRRVPGLRYEGRGPPSLRPHRVFFLLPGPFCVRPSFQLLGTRRLNRLLELPPPCFVLPCAEHLIRSLPKPALSRLPSLVPLVFAFPHLLAEEFELRRQYCASNNYFSALIPSSPKILRVRLAVV